MMTSYSFYVLLITNLKTRLYIKYTKFMIIQDNVIYFFIFVNKIQDVLIEYLLFYILIIDHSFNPALETRTSWWYSFSGKSLKNF